MRLESKGKISQRGSEILLGSGTRRGTVQKKKKQDTGYTHHGVSCAVLASLLIKYRMSLSKSTHNDTQNGRENHRGKDTVGWIRREPIILCRPTINAN